MEEWKEYRLGDVCTELSDGLHKAPKFVLGGDYIFVNAKNIINGNIVDNDPTKKTTYEEYLKYSSPLNDTTILYSIDGTIGNVALYRGEKCVLGKGACYINPNPKYLDRLFLYYELKTPRFKAYIDKMSTGSTIKHISLKTMREYVFTCPNLDKQRKISSILKSLDDKIENNRKINENLEQQAQALFKSWFVDFEPFRDQPFVESELGMIPEGWRVGTLSEIAEYSKLRINIKEINTQTYVSTENMLPNKQGITEASGIPDVEKVTRYEIGDVLISIIRPYFKKLHYCNHIGGCSGDVMCFHPLSKEYRGYLYCSLYDDVFFDYVMSGTKGTKMPRGDKRQIMNYRIIIPSNSIINQFNNCVLLLLSQIDNNRKQSLRLSHLRDTLLPKLMSGEITL